jgi:hypothetical protein
LSKLLYTKGNVVGKPKELKVYLLNDLHFGSKAVDEDLLERIFLEIDKDRRSSRILINGDLIEGVTRNSKGDIYEQLLSPKKQVEYAVEKFRPYADLIDVVTQGNHDARIENEVSFDPVEIFCEKLGILDKYMKYECVVGYSWNKCFYSIQMHHGSGGASTIGAIINKMKKMKKSNAHVMYIAHHHKEVAVPYINYAIDPFNHVVRKEKHWLVCGNTITNFADYAKKFAYEEHFPSQAVLKMSGKRKAKGIEVEWIR